MEVRRLGCHCSKPMIDLSTVTVLISTAISMASLLITVHFPTAN